MILKIYTPTKEIINKFEISFNCEKYFLQIVKLLYENTFRGITRVID